MLIHLPTYMPSYLPTYLPDYLPIYLPAYFYHGQYFECKPRPSCAGLKMGSAEACNRSSNRPLLPPSCIIAGISSMPAYLEAAAACTVSCA